MAKLAMLVLLVCDLITVLWKRIKIKGSYNT